MQKFLKEVASYLYQKYNGDFSMLKVVFPNRRAGLFFQKYLSEIISTPVISPEIITISELNADFTSLRKADQNALVIELYHIYCEVTKSKEPIDEFFFWGELMLSDFNDIDKYLVDHRQLFQNIQSLKEIDSGFDFLTEEQLHFLSSFWNTIISTTDSSAKDSFLSIWKFLPEIYQQFKQKLEQKGIGYEGMIYRQMTENLSQQMPELSYHIAIVGFNALNNCEKKLFNYLENNTTTTFFWDYDEYYLNNLNHEAGSFMRENLGLFAMPDDFYFDNNTFSKLNTINCIAVPGFTGQATVAANWLKNEKANISNRFDNTALVLCDEDLLPHLLNVIPDTFEETNITMGYPLKNSPAFGLIKGLADIDKNERKDDKQASTFFYRNVFSLLSQPLIKPILGDLVDALNQDVLERNKIYIGVNDFKDSPFLMDIFSLPKNAKAISEYLRKILKTVFAHSEEDPLLKESIYQLYLSINRLEEVLFDATYNVEISKKLYYQLLIRQLERVTVPFEGEPLKGLQIMGFLETRCLDFDNLLLFSFNDQKLPGNTHQNSFIPYNLRRGFGLPMVEHHNAMYAYYFYRLIQRAKNVTLAYDSRTEGLTNGEVSRFATQLKYEAGHLSLNEKQAVFNYVPAELKTISVEKSPAIIAQMLVMAKNKAFSPSALDKYIECSLRFYFDKLEKIKESDEVFEEINHLLFGRIAHLTLEELYKPFIQKEIQKTDIEAILKDKNLLDKTLAFALEKEFFKGEAFKLQGKNILVYDIIKKYIVRILKYDATIAPFEILGLEQKYYSTLEITVEEKPIEIKIGGIIDRLDKVKGRIRVVDYKTGQSEGAISNIEALMKPASNRNKAAFQTMLYAMCVVDQNAESTPVLPAVYGARNVFLQNFNPIFQLKGNDVIFQANQEPFKTGLKLILEEMFNPQVPFTQTRFNQKCKTCSYNVLCNR